MITSKLFLVSDETSVNLDNEDILSINLLDDVFEKDFPVLLDSVIIVGFLTKEDEDPDQAILWLTIYNNNISLKKQSIRADFKGKSIYGLIIHAREISIIEEGSLDFVLSNQMGDEMDRYAISVHHGELLHEIETPVPPM
ncbi:hypothetical protein GVN16_03660 [Emticicia sp. CRIBPO]|uniref:hypothetical protein n=1 Tax=Emticicia sp. CRIBPO TaxID=2683258 RepID=UPI001412BE5C|nr:hypothetical protein [Emticicia sp. CRIBPO]NBA84838.1 hypothetical protein [Emticicia sp. CRIBPO]